MDLFGHMATYDYGEVHVKRDHASSLRAIVAIHDSGRAGDRFYLLMEFVDGPNLRQVIRAHANHYWEHSWDLVILFGQRRYLSPARQRRIIALERKYLDLVRGIIREGVRRRVFHRVEPSVAAFSLFGILNTIDAWYDRTGALRPDALVRQVERLFLGGLAADTRRLRAQWQARLSSRRR